MKRVNKIILVSIIINLSLIMYASAQNYKVIVNNSNEVTALTRSEVSNYLLKKRTNWSNGSNIVPVDLGSQSAVRAAFSVDVHGKTISQVRSYWQQSVFSGKATPAQEMNSDADVINFVKNNAGAIGYISSGADAQGVKVITLN